MNIARKNYHLIVDCEDLGQCKSYYRLKELGGWLFEMVGKRYHIFISYDDIQYFSSCGDLEIVTYNF